MIGEENISEFLSNSDVQNKKWNVSTLTTEEIQGKYLCELIYFMLRQIWLKSF